MITIGIDPGIKSGLAVFHADRLVFANKVSAPDWHVMARMVALQAAMKASSVDLNRHGKITQPGVWLSVEGQFFSRSPKTLATLVENATSWRIAGEILGARVTDLIAPQTWQSTFGLGTGKRKQRQEKAQALVEAHFPKVRATDPDIVAAVLIALHTHIRRDQDYLLGPFAWAQREPRGRAKTKTNQSEIF